MKVFLSSPDLRCLRCAPEDEKRPADPFILPSEHPLVCGFASVQSSGGSMSAVVLATHVTADLDRSLHSDRAGHIPLPSSSQMNAEAWARSSQDQLASPCAWPNMT